MRPWIFASRPEGAPPDVEAFYCPPSGGDYLRGICIEVSSRDAYGLPRNSTNSISDSAASMSALLQATVPAGLCRVCRTILCCICWPRHALRLRNLMYVRAANN